MVKLTAHELLMAMTGETISVNGVELNFLAPDPFFPFEGKKVVKVNNVKVEEDIFIEPFTYEFKYEIHFFDNEFSFFHIVHAEFKEAILFTGSKFDFLRISGGTFHDMIQIVGGVFRVFIIEGGEFENNFYLGGGKFEGLFQIRSSYFKKEFEIEGGKFDKAVNISAEFQEFKVSGGSFPALNFLPHCKIFYLTLNLLIRSEINLNSLMLAWLMLISDLI
ncbi:MAG: hypothetical protein AAFN93_26050, partial [Bacteroidota bacterium]